VEKVVEKYIRANNTNLSKIKKNYIQTWRSPGYLPNYILRIKGEEVINNDNKK